MREALGASEDDGPPLEWIAILEAALATASVLAAEDALPQLTKYPGAIVPRFGEVWVPFVLAARERLTARAGSALDGWADAALLALEGSLLAQISWIAERTLYELFDAFRRERSAAPAVSVQADESVGSLESSVVGTGAPRTDLYRRFVLDLLSGGLVPLFRSQSALARQVSLMAENWTAAVSELVLRVEADRDALNDLFGASGGVFHVVTGLSDRHAGGRTILMLGFRSEAWVIYKPRTVGMESAWNDFLRFLSERGAGPLAHLQVLVRDGYGYAERARGATLGTTEEAQSYFRSAGALLAVAWVLGADDLHMDNVIATSSGPVVVDAESLLQPELATGSGGAEASKGALARWSARSSASVLRSGLLTIPRLDRDGTSVDIGGLTGEGGHPTRTKSRAFRHPNTDEMTLASEGSLSPAMPNLPVFEGRRLVPRDFPNEVSAGFATMVRSLVSLAPEIDRAGGPLESLARERTRLVFRPSDLYARVLLELTAPRYLSDGLERSFAIDSLNAVFRRELVRPRLWPLTVEERVALEDFDIPYFSVAAGSRTILANSGEPVEGHLEASGFESARRRLHSLKISASSALSTLSSHLSAKPAAPGPSPEELLELAEEIGADVEGTVLEAAPEPDSLYGGRIGIAVFLAALFRTTGKRRFFESARSLWRVSGETIRGTETLPDDAPIGACNGVGSWIYALSLLSHLCGEEEPLSLARDAAALLTKERIEGARFDVESGAAGAILGLLALHALTGDESVLDRATSCGEHLLRSRSELADGVWGWPSDEGPCLAGFAHGAAGIALALGRLSEVTGRGDFHEAAFAACRYEKTLYDSAQGNWPVLSKSGDRLFLTAWCHGAPGIALARAGLLASFQKGRSSEFGRGSDVVESLHAALTTSRAASLLSTDHLCCGNAGLVETLLFSGEVLGRADLVEAARARAAMLLDAA
ncbi:MAG: type 2 lanthipeptide synthetase LanM family protein, partial [Thermoanaerobaculia bacterium]